MTTTPDPAATRARIRALQSEIAELRRGEKHARLTSDSWCSPPEIADPLEGFFAGPVDVDPCSNERSIIRARVALTSGGLTIPWVIPRTMGRPRKTVYQNEPYSQAGLWTTKMLHEIRIDHVRELVRLTMMATSTQWWASMCQHRGQNPRILALERLKFLDPDAVKAGQKRMTCRFEPALIYIGHRATLFTTAFSHLTRWTTWGRT